MAMMDVGDVLAIPVGDGRFGVAQVLAKHRRTSFFVGVFDAVLDEAEVARAAQSIDRPLLFLALVMDERVHDGTWSVIDRRPVISDAPLPAYKLVLGPPPSFRYVVEDALGERQRPATEDEQEHFPYRKVVSAVRLEKALRAHLGLVPWESRFDSLRPGNFPTSIDAF